jgi:hypothetical protein
MLLNKAAMRKGPDFVMQLEVVMGKLVGQIVCSTIIRNQLSKFNKDQAALTAEDCKILTQNVQKAVSLFVTKEEGERLQQELNKLLKTFFP